MSPLLPPSSLPGLLLAASDLVSVAVKLYNCGNYHSFGRSFVLHDVPFVIC